MTVADLDEIILDLYPHVDHPDPVIKLLVKSVREIATHLRNEGSYQAEQNEKADSRLRDKFGDLL